MKSTCSLIPYIYCSPHLRGRPIFSSLSRAYKTYGGGRGSKVNVRFFQNLKIKMTILFQQNHHFIAFFMRTLSGIGGGGGEGGDLQKEYVFTVRS